MTDHMNIAVITHYIHPDVVTNSRLLMDAALGFVDSGHKVRFYSASPSNQGSIPDFPSEISIRRHWSPRFDPRGVKRRLINSAFVAAFIFIRLLFSRRPDIILVDTTTPFLGPCAWAISKVRGHRYVYLATELYPDAAVALGFIRSGGIIERIWDYSNRLVYGRASQVIVIGPRLREKVARHLEGGVEAPKLNVVHNWADPTEIRPVIKSENWWLTEHGLDDKFIVLYSGNIGLSHDLGTLISVAEILSDRDDLRIVVIGEGPNKARLVSEAKTKNLKNVLFLPYQPVEVLPFSLSSGDFSVVTLATGMDQLTIPSKLYPAMAAGQAILALMGPETDVGEMVIEYDIGIRVTQGDSEGMAKELVSLLNDPERVLSLKSHSRMVFEQNFTREISIGLYLEILDKAVKS
jgi:colanic acid biosynthesis glycosyl transferase WcaI